MYPRFIRWSNNKSFFLFGPRGVGKTTWIRTTFPKAIYIDLLEAELFNDLLANPQRLENHIPQGWKEWIIIDEVQKIPELLDEVHRLIEKYKFKFILTCSSARKIKRSKGNLLAWRALVRFMHPLTCKEIGKDFSLERSLKYGHLPSIFSEKEPKAYLESYVRTYLEEEIRQEGLVRNLGSFARFLESASFSQGSILNISEVARDCAVERKVVENYFSILEDLRIGYFVPVFSKRAKRRLVQHKKFFFFDVGVYRTLRPAGPLDRPEEIDGIALETLIFQELNATIFNLGLDYKIFFWRTSNNIEVDFVLYGTKGFFAFEIKRTSKINSSMLRGLKIFLSDYPQAKCFFIYQGKHNIHEGKIEIVTAEWFLSHLADIIT
jgi:predicted AAA+ superfamily ATPase